MKIMLFSPFFAPASSVGAVRMSSLAEYLSRKHQVVVFTLSEESIKKEYAHILKSKRLEKVEYTYFSMDNIYKYPSRGVMGDIRKKFEEQIKCHQFDIVLVSSGPVYSEGIVQKVCCKYNIPYVLDLRDLDLLDYYFKEKKKNIVLEWKHNIAQYIKIMIEKKTCLRAAAITVANPEHVEMLKDNYQLNTKKVISILNGFDDTKLKAITLRTCSDTEFKIGCFGKLYEYDSERTLRLLKIVDKLHSKYGNVSIKHIGEGKNAIEKLIADHHLSPEIYQGMEIMDYSEGIAEMSECNMFAMVWVHAHSLSTKIFDYLALNKPIVSISPSNVALKNMICNLQNVLFSDDDENVSNFIEKVMNEPILVADSNLDKFKYARTNSNKQFETLLCRILNQ